MSVLAFAELLYDSEIGTSLRESLFAFPIVEGIHLIGLALSVGLLFFIDLRLVGLVFRHVPIPQILKQLRPWLLGGFAVTMATGALLFVAGATKLIELPVFLWKLAFIVFAGINAAWFEFKWGRNVQQWGYATTLPTGVLVAAWGSLILWSLVVITGRLIPYLSY
ncbi:hypothetical protein LG198_05220 [Methylobacillus arboreus]|uniref:DUF6644 family protein n=1 Tax=Methylobacillus arboreus TaxID=755170 RepID=UPI001E36E311|nr:DUF6644 family protein [Methylobacillus arboreus]MCB5190122.1 hypothetical protein [Methylobacillus arboreus]